MKKAVLIILVTICFSCKKENKQKDIEVSEPTTEKHIPDNILKIKLEAKVLEDNVFQVFYVGDSPDGPYNEKNIVASKVKGSDEFQVLQFNLPANILPFKFRIDLGENKYKYETIVEIKKIILELNDNEIEIDNLIVNNFFQPNIYLEKVESGYLRKVVEGKYDPFLAAKPILIKKIELEL